MFSMEGLNFYREIFFRKMILFLKLITCISLSFFYMMVNSKMELRGMVSYVPLIYIANRTIIINYCSAEICMLHVFRKVSVGVLPIF